MCDCKTCRCGLTTLSVGPKGDKGDTGATGATGTGLLTPVIDVVTATLDLTATQTGSKVYLDRATGSTIQLPSQPTAGTNYTFETVTELVAGSYTINANGAGLDTIIGFVYGNKSATAPTLFKTTPPITQISMNGSTTGGLIGTSFTLTYDGASKWNTSGVTYGSGALATPFS